MLPSSRRSAAPPFSLGHQGKGHWKDLRTGEHKQLLLTSLAQASSLGCLHLLLGDEMKIPGSQYVRGVHLLIPALSLHTASVIPSPSGFASVLGTFRVRPSFLQVLTFSLYPLCHSSSDGFIYPFILLFPFFFSVLSIWGRGELSISSFGASFSSSVFFCPRFSHIRAGMGYILT